MLVPLEDALEVVPFLDSQQLFLYVLVVRPLLRRAILDVAEHRVELWLQIRAERIGVSAGEHVLNLDVRLQLLTEHRNVTCPRQEALAEVDQNVD